MTTDELYNDLKTIDYYTDEYYNILDRHFSLYIDEISNEWLKYFLDTLGRILKVQELLQKTEYGAYNIDYAESTVGWEDAFNITCEEFKTDDLKEYYKKLCWEESDIFDSYITDKILKINNIERE